MFYRRLTTALILTCLCITYAMPYTTASAQVRPSILAPEDQGPTEQIPGDSTPSASLNEATQSATPQSSGATEPPIELEVPDCPGAKRSIDASHLPPSIYPKPNCGSSNPGTTPVSETDGEFGTGQGAPGAGRLFWQITHGQTYPISQGYGLTDFAIGNPIYDYCNSYNTPGHCGVDVNTPTNIPLFSPVAGTVEIAGGTTYFCDDDGSNGGVGCGVNKSGQLNIALANGDILVLGHMRSISVSVGQTVSVGTPVGLSGASNGPHVHVEYRKSDGAGGFTTRDPRDVFNVPYSASVQGVSTSSNGSSKVLADITLATNYGQFIEKYGFFTPDGASARLELIKNNPDAFAAMRDLAVKYAPANGIEPELLVMWVYAETNRDGNPFDSYHYSNCGDSSYEIDTSCSSTYSGGWQIGYGQQFSVGANESLLTAAFQATHGDPSDAALVKQVGQNVLDKSGISKTFPSNLTVSLIARSMTTCAGCASDANYWAYTLMRDPAMSMYLLGAELKGDIDGSNGSLYNAVKGWGSYYTDAVWQEFSNTLNDVLLNWGIAGSVVTGNICQVGVVTTSGSCSTEPDSLNGLTVDEFVQRINENMADYKSIAQCADVPWQMMAAIHLKEAALLHDLPNSPGGPWQFDPAPPGVDTHNFTEAGCHAANLLQEKAQEPPLSKKLTATMDPKNKADEDLVKHALFGYNGRGGFEWNIEQGKCKPVNQGDPALEWDCSAYVTENLDSQHTGMCTNGSIDGGQTQQFCNGIDGAWKIYVKLVYSTYDSSGKLLVYGGMCNLTNEVVDGMSLPTKANVAISTNFWQPYPDSVLTSYPGIFPNHIGIDIANEVGDPVFAIADGTIAESGWSTGGGYHIILYIKDPATNHERWVWYGHLDPNGLAAKDVEVKAGQQIGKTGPLIVNDPSGAQTTNGATTGPHLHFDIRTQVSETNTDTDHVNPCKLQVFKQGYPTLDCNAYGTKGSGW